MLRKEWVHQKQGVGSISPEAGQCARPPAFHRSRRGLLRQNYAVRARFGR